MQKWKVEFFAREALTKIAIKQSRTIDAENARDAIRIVAQEYHNTNTVISGFRAGNVE